MKRNLIVSMVLATGLAAAILAGPSLNSPVARAEGLDAYSVYYVAPGANCAGMTPCYGGVQAAVDAVDAPGDVVRVAAGEYADVHVRSAITQVVYISKTVTLEGGYSTADGYAAFDPGANPTTLNAGRQGRVIVVAVASATIRGFTLTGAGGSVHGGGIYASNSTTTIRDNQITDNTITGSGGGVRINRGSSQILHNHVYSNSATWNGGIYVENDANVTIADNRIVDNVASLQGGGMGMASCAGATLSVVRNTIVGNQAGTYGGAAYVSDSSIRFVNNLVGANQADKGAGLYLTGVGASYPASVTLQHNTLGGGFSSGHGVYVADWVTATLVNNIIAYYAIGITNTFPASSVVVAEFTLFDGNGIDYGGGVASASEVTGTPDFVNPAERDYHIGPGSAAIDAAMFVGLTEDVDGDMRPIGPVPDIGADEARLRVYLPLVLRNA